MIAIDYYQEIKHKLIDHEVYLKVKDYSKERNRVMTYYEIGKLLNDAGSKYGDNIVADYSIKLTLDLGKKYDKSTVYKMRKFYLISRNKKVAPLVPHLNWSHCLLLIPLNDIDVVFYYAYQIVNRNLSKRQLHEAILSHEYERLPDHTKLELLSGNPNKRAEDYIKEPIVIRNSNNYESLSEKVLQQIILENIPSFLEELGEGFTFIRNEYRIRMGDYYNYIDLLLFNYIYNCFVVIELKVTELKKEHIGQISTYMNYIDRNIKCIYHDKTIGIIICKKNHKYIMEYCSDSRIYAREFLIIHDV